MMLSNEVLKQRKIVEIIDNFDFVRVHKAMVATGHKWMTNYGEFEMKIPSVGMIVYTLIDKLDRAIDSYLKNEGGVFTTASGGFCISVYENENIDPDMTDPYYVTVKFCIAEEEA